MAPEPLKSLRNAELGGGASALEVTPAAVQPPGEGLDKMFLLVYVLQHLLRSESRPTENNQDS